MKNKKLIIIIFAVVAIALGVYFVFGNNHKNATTKKDMQAVLAKVEKLAIVPKNEDPTLATVTDTNSLKDSFLKANAKNGDKVLIFYNAKKVYIYRPSENKIVNIGPLVVDASVSQVKNTRVMIKTGNNNQTVSQNISTQLSQNYNQLVVKPVEKAVRQNYPTTIIIDLTDGDKYDLVTNMAKTLGAQRGVLPTGESKPENTDILIITGTDKQ